MTQQQPQQVPTVSVADHDTLKSEVRFRYLHRVSLSKGQSPKHLFLVVCCYM